MKMNLAIMVGVVFLSYGCSTIVIPRSDSTVPVLGVEVAIPGHKNITLAPGKPNVELDLTKEEVEKIEAVALAQDKDGAIKNLRLTHTSGNPACKNSDVEIKPIPMVKEYLSKASIGDRERVDRVQTLIVSVNQPNDGDVCTSGGYIQAEASNFHGGKSLTNELKYRVKGFAGPTE